MELNTRQLMLFAIFGLGLIVLILALAISGAFSSGSSGGVGGAFTTVDVPNGTNPEASLDDTLVLIEGPNITITGDAGTDTITIGTTGSATNAFTTIDVPTGTDPVATSATDTLIIDSPTGTVSIVGSTSNTIDFDISSAFYSQGVWTPGLADNSLDGSGEGQTYFQQVGTYTRVGDQVFIQGSVGLESRGSLTTTNLARIVGLPFTSAPGSAVYGGVNITYYESMTLAASGSISGIVDPNTSRMYLQKASTVNSSTNLLISEFSDDAYLQFVGQYTATP
jgi:hypothetical protein